MYNHILIKGFFVLHSDIFFEMYFTIYDHHGRPASKIFNRLLSFNYFNPEIILIKTTSRFRRFKVWFGTKAAKIGDFGRLNITFGH